MMYNLRRYLPILTISGGSEDWCAIALMILSS